MSHNANQHPWHCSHSDMRLHNVHCFALHVRATMTCTPARLLALRFLTAIHRVPACRQSCRRLPTWRMAVGRRECPSAPVTAGAPAVKVEVHPWVRSRSFGSG